MSVGEWWNAKESAEIDQTEEAFVFRAYVAEEWRLPSEVEIIQSKVLGSRAPGRSIKTWTDNIKSWTELSCDQSLRETRDGNRWTKIVHVVANPWLQDG